MMKPEDPQRPYPSYRSHSVPSVPLVLFVPSRPFDETALSAAHQTQSTCRAAAFGEGGTQPTCRAVALPKAEASATADGEGGSENRLPTRFDRTGGRTEPAIFACPGRAGQDRRESPPMRPNPTKSD